MLESQWNEHKEMQSTDAKYRNNDYKEVQKNTKKKQKDQKEM